MKEFDIYLNRHFTECDITIYSLPLREYVSARSRLVLKTAPLDAYIAVPLGRGGAVLAVQAQTGELVTTALTQAELGVQVGAGMSKSADAVVKTIYESACFRVASATNSASIARSIDTAGASSVGILCVADGLSTALPLGTAESSFRVTAASTGETQTQHSLGMQATVAVVSDIAHTAKQSFVTASIDIPVTTEAELSATRLRTLSEMDDMTLQSIDDMSLSELDVVAL